MLHQYWGHLTLPRVLWYRQMLRIGDRSSLEPGGQWRDGSPHSFFQSEDVTSWGTLFHRRKGMFGSEAWGGSFQNLSFRSPVRDIDRSQSIGVARQSQREQHAFYLLEFVSAVVRLHCAIPTRGDQWECWCSFSGYVKQVWHRGRREECEGLRTRTHCDIMDIMRTL